MIRMAGTVLIHHHSSVAQAAALRADILATGGAAEIVAADLSRREDIEALVGRCIAAYGPIDCLINNASAFHLDRIEDVTWDSLHAHMLPNLAAPLLLSRDFAAAFAAREGGPEAAGLIINMLDQKIANLNPDFLSYTLSKVALHGLTQLLAMALAPRIRVCGVAPGVTLISGRQTEESFQRAWTAPPAGRSSTPEDIVAAVRFIVETRSYTGQTLFLDGGEILRRRPRDVAFDVQGSDGTEGQGREAPDPVT
jgi:NAD(P)-dependent dehydrogenase (short-subunit alcohol dehydrogenase family)